MKQALKKPTLGSVFNTLKNLFLVTLGTASIAFGTAVFMIPFDLVSGGMSGMAIILDLVIPIEFITVDIIITALSWIFFILGLIFLGKAFAMKTLVSTIAYPIFVSLFMRLSDPSVLGGYFYLQGNAHPDIALVLAAVGGGSLVGLGCALSFLGGGSTGGIDVIALLVSKYFPRIKSPRVLLTIDTTVVILGVFIIQDFVTSMLGIVSAIISSTLVEKVFLGGQKAFIAQIVSDKYAEINKRIITEAKRTTTVVGVTGGYSGAEKKMLLVSFTMRQYHDVLRIVSTEDKNAFVTIHRAHEISGEGWTWHKVKPADTADKNAASEDVESEDK